MFGVEQYIGLIIVYAVLKLLDTVFFIPKGVQYHTKSKMGNRQWVTNTYRHVKDSVSDQIRKDIETEILPRIEEYIYMNVPTPKQMVDTIMPEVEAAISNRLKIFMADLFNPKKNPYIAEVASANEDLERAALDHLQENEPGVVAGARLLERAKDKYPLFYDAAHFLSALKKERY